MKPAPKTLGFKIFLLPFRGGWGPGCSMVFHHGQYPGAWAWWRAPSSWINPFHLFIIMGNLDCPDQPLEGYYTFFRDQLGSDLRFSIPEFYTDVAHCIFLGLFLPNFTLIISASMPRPLFISRCTIAWSTPLYSIIFFLSILRVWSLRNLYKGRLKSSRPRPLDPVCFFDYTYWIFHILLFLMSELAFFYFCRESWDEGGLRSEAVAKKDAEAEKLKARKADTEKKIFAKKMVEEAKRTAEAQEAKERRLLRPRRLRLGRFRKRFLQQRK